MSKYQHTIRKIEVTYVLINSVGVVSISNFIFAICPVKTFLVNLMISNNNSVALHPLSKVVACC